MNFASENQEDKMSFFRSGSPTHFFFVKFLKTFKEKKKFISTLFLVFLSFIVLFNFCAPSFSNENIQLPDLSKIRPFSAAANYMSLEGFVASYCRVNYGMDLSRGEARRMVKENLKAHRHEQALVISTHPKEMKRPVIKREAKTFTITIKNVDQTNPKPLIITKPVTCKKRMVLIPFRNLSKNSKAPVEIVMHYTKKYFESKGFEVIILNKENPKTDFDSICDVRLLELAKNYDTDFIIAGEVNHFSRYKKISLPGFIVNMVFSSVHNYSDVELSAKIFKVSSNKYIYANKAYGHKKHQFMGAFHGTKGVVSYAVNSSVTKLFDDFKL